MSVDKRHAYGRGKIHSRPKPSMFGWLAHKVSRWLESASVERVWRVFEANCVMGSDCFLGPNSWCTNLGAKDDIQLGTRVYLRGLLRSGGRGGSIEIGDEVYIGDDTIISSECRVVIGGQTLISHGVHIFDTVGHPLDPQERVKDWRIVMGVETGPRPKAPSEPVIIGERVWIGFGATIMRGVTIGEGSVVAAGAVVVDDVAPYTVVAGNPAKQVKALPGFKEHE